jgi:hypothetical protein
LLTAPRISRTPAFALFFALCHSVDGPSSTGCFMLRSISKPFLSSARSSIPSRVPQPNVNKHREAAFMNQPTFITSFSLSCPTIFNSLNPSI